MMKNLFMLVFSILLTGTLFVSCGTSKTLAEKEQEALLIKEKVESFDFRFNAKIALADGRTKFLNHSYNVTVSKDSVIAFLPFYGRMYSPPMDPSEIGIKFVSTDFEYKVTAGKRRGTWNVFIKTSDTDRTISLWMNVSDNGTAQLSVTDPNRSPVSFEGNIE